MRETSPPTKPDEKSLRFLEESECLLGLNPALRSMILKGVPLTVKNYMDLAFWGEIPEEIDITDQQWIDAIAEFEASSGD